MWEKAPYVKSALADRTTIHEYDVVSFGWSSGSNEKDQGPIPNNSAIDRPFRADEATMRGDVWPRGSYAVKQAIQLLDRIYNGEKARVLLADF